MNTTDVIQAISAGICFYAGITHLMIGLRSEPKDRVHLSFAMVSLLFGMYSVGLFALYAALDTGSLSRYVFVDRWGIALNYLALAALFWFIAAYTSAKDRIVPFVLSGLYILIAISNFILPYPWVYTDIELTPVFPPDIVVAPWYSVEQVVTFLLILLYSAHYINKQYRRGEKGAARALGVATGIFLLTLLWDYGIEYGLIDTVLMQQYGFVAFIVIMSLHLSGQTVKAEKEVRRLNVELEERVLARTADLSEVNRQLQHEIAEREQAEELLQQRVVELSALHSVAQTMAATTDFRKALNSVAETVTYLFDAELTVITVPAADDNELRTLAAYRRSTASFSEVAPAFRIDDTLATRQALHEGVALVLSNVQDRPLTPVVRAYVEKLGVQTIMIVPLQIQGVIMGTLAMGATQADRTFTTNEITLAKTIAGDIAAAVKTAQLSEQAQLAAVDAERQRLARDLHDSVTQSLYSLTLLSNGWGTMVAQGRMEQQQVVDSFKQLGEVGQQGLKEMRLLLHQLRPPILKEVGLVGAVQQRLDAVERRVDVETHLYTRGEVDQLPLAVEEQLFHITLEALNNTLRHAKATTVTVNIQADNGCLKLSVQDNGLGFDPTAPSIGLGLTTMQERAQSIGGTVSVTSAPRKGTTVETMIALQPDERV